MLAVITFPVFAFICIATGCAFYFGWPVVQDWVDKWHDSKIATMRGVVAAKEKKIADLDDNIHALVQEVADLKADNDKLRSMAGEHSSNCRWLAERVMELEAQLAEARKPKRKRK